MESPSGAVASFVSVGVEGGSSASGDPPSCPLDPPSTPVSTNPDNPHSFFLFVLMYYPSHEMQLGPTVGNY
jgi:hypothetical protein